MFEVSKALKFYFLVGSQELYGRETLEAVDRDAAVIASSFNDDPALPCGVVFTHCIVSSKAACEAVEMAERDPMCAGVITWMHTFSPSKMWIRALSELRKPCLHLNTQFNRAIPWDTIDMDFMNLNQSAHGDREHGYIAARLRLRTQILCGYWEDEDVRAGIASFMRAAAGVAASRETRVLRISDNMRSVAVTDGDKVEAQLRLGWEIEHYGVGDICAEVDAVTKDEQEAVLSQYRENYDIATDDMASVEYQAREEAAIKKFMDERGFTAFHTNFEDLQGLRQLPGLASQELMRRGYGFAAEGDWKTAAMCRVVKAMTSDKSGGTAFMEDYTYDFTRGSELIMGSHMLEVCPSIASGRPRIEVHPLSIGGREAPARLLFRAHPGSAVVISLVDMGGRLRMIVNDIDVVEQPFDMPHLPVAAVLWRPKPDMRSSARCWMAAGGSHHSVLSFDVDADTMRQFAEMLGIEFVHIGAGTDFNELRRDLALGDIIYGHRDV